MSKCVLLVFIAVQSSFLNFAFADKPLLFGKNCKVTTSDSFDSHIYDGSPDREIYEPALLVRHEVHDGRIKYVDSGRVIYTCGKAKLSFFTHNDLLHVFMEGGQPVIRVDKVINPNDPASKKEGEELLKSYIRLRGTRVGADHLLFQHMNDQLGIFENGYRTTEVMPPLPTSGQRVNAPAEKHKIP